MNELLGVTIDDLVASLKARRIRIPSEIGAFVALETCEALLRGPAAVRGADVRIAEDGTVAIFAPPNSASPEDSARAVTGILASLLVAAGTGVPPMLIALVEDGPKTGSGALLELRDELEATLVPLNRSAARRVLSRMIREARRASLRPEARLDEVPEDRLDEALDDFLGGPKASSASLDARRRGGASDPDLQPPTFSPAASAAALSDPFADPKRDAHPVSVFPQARADDDDDALDDLLSEPSMREPLAAHAPPPAGEPARSPVPERPATARSPVPEQSSAPERAPASERAPQPERSPAPQRAPVARETSARGLDDFEAEPKPRSGGGGLVWVLAFMVVGLVAVVAVGVIRPDLVDLALGRAPAPEVPAGPTDEERDAAIRAHRALFGALTVTSTPDRAQVLMFVGRGPAIARELATGMAYEFVAIADGRAPTRAVVPADAVFEATDSGLRYELAMQTGDAEMDLAHMVLGETRLPRDALGVPTPTLGSVRVLTTPPGAKVYLLVGFTPQVHVENVRTDEAVELLVYREGHALERVVVGPSDWTAGEDGARTAQVNVTLRPTTPQRIR